MVGIVLSALYIGQLMDALEISILLSPVLQMKKLRQQRSQVACQGYTAGDYRRTAPLYNLALRHPRR